MRSLRLTLLLWVVAHAGATAQETAPTFGDALTLEPVSRGGRHPFPIDPVAAQIALGVWTDPREGDRAPDPNGADATWTAVERDADGAFRTPQGGYLFTTVRATAPGDWLLACAGHIMVYVNGEPRMGDPYATGRVRAPVSLRAGDNTFVFLARERRLAPKLLRPAAPACLDASDVTLPDLIVREPVDTWGALVVCNASSRPLDRGVLVCSGDSLTPTETPLPWLGPWSVYKAPFRIVGPAPESAGPRALQATLRSGRLGERPQTATLALAAVEPADQQRRTFLSAIDESVQYYAVLPATASGEEDALPGLTLTLHGAGVEASGQAAAYGARPDMHLVAPTNRREYGFDWEEWGRLDALEALADAQARYPHAPDRVYLTGHSMGGHGTWQLGVLFPDRFAAVAPSAGWRSFDSYGGRRDFDENGVAAMFGRAANSGRTELFASNLAGLGVYILHGDADETVPVAEARAMRDLLAQLRVDAAYYEEPGAGHWWDDERSAGAACVDWPPLFAFLADRRLTAPESVDRVRFVTPSPGVSARRHWVEVSSQQTPMDPSRVDIALDRAKREFAGVTDNVLRLALDLRGLEPGNPVTAALDGGRPVVADWPGHEPVLRLVREAEGWALDVSVDTWRKRPERYGPYKEAYRNNVALVYGTAGTPEEAAWAYARARFDAETFWVRGNGALEVLPDTAFDPERLPARNLVLYGNADTHRLWAATLAQCPVQAARGEVRVGARTIAGEGLGVLIAWPRGDCPDALTAVVSGSGMTGMRATDRLPVFVSGTGYPDFTVFTPRALEAGVGGVLVAGYFDESWQLQDSHTAWAEETVR